MRISGGNDKQGFPMKQGVLSTGRVRLLLSKGHSCYRPRRTGERKRKSVRGCIVDANLSVLNLVIVRKGKVIAQATLLSWLDSGSARALLCIGHWSGHEQGGYLDVNRKLRMGKMALNHIGQSSLFAYY